MESKLALDVLRSFLLVEITLFAADMDWAGEFRSEEDGLAVDEAPIGGNGDPLPEDPALKGGLTLFSFELKGTKSLFRLFGRAGLAPSRGMSPNSCSDSGLLLWYNSSSSSSSRYDNRETLISSRKSFTLRLMSHKISQPSQLGNDQQRLRHFDFQSFKEDCVRN